MTAEDTEDTTIAFTEEVVKIWYQNKKDLNFGKSTDSDFLIFILYNTLKSLSNKFSDNIVLPPVSTCNNESPKKISKPDDLQETISSLKREDSINSDGSINLPLRGMGGINQRHLGGMFECPKCKKSFATKAYLGKHDKRCGMNPLKMYHCQHCAMVLTSIGSLNIHIKQKHRDVRYSCDQCNKKFKNPEYVKHHVRVTHNKIKDYKCAQCEKRFTQRGSLQIHMKMVHQKLRDYPCRVCDKQFGCKSHLTRHMRKLHSDVKELRCEICMKLFENQSELAAHTKSAHYQTEFICNICNKAFVLKHTLAQHIIKFHQKEQRPKKTPTVAQMLQAQNDQLQTQQHLSQQQHSSQQQMEHHNLNKDMRDNTLLRVGVDPSNNLLRSDGNGLLRSDGNGLLRSDGNSLLRSDGLLRGDSLLHQAQDISMLGRGNPGHIQNSMLIGRDNSHLVDTSHNNLLPVVQFLSNHPS